MSAEETLPAQVAVEVASSFLPGVGPVVSRLLGAVQKEWVRNRSTVLAAAELTSGMSREDLATRIESHPELVAPVTRLLYDAAMTGQTELLEAMGAVFGTAASAPSTATDCELILGGLRNLRADDVRLLGSVRDSVVMAGADTTRPGRRQINGMAQVAEDLGTDEESVAFALVRLSGQGFVRESAGYGGSTYETTRLGKSLCDAFTTLRESQARRV